MLNGTIISEQRWFNSSFFVPKYLLHLHINFICLTEQIFWDRDSFSDYLFCPVIVTVFVYKFLTLNEETIRLYL